MKHAVILQATTATTEFRTSFGFYNKQIHDLKQAGYTIHVINVVDSTSLIDRLESFEPSSIGFLWVRMHGTETSLLASDKLTINNDNINKLFSNLSSIISDDGCILLDSCETGSFQADSMQIAFAKLTMSKPRVTIVAPSSILHISYFALSDDKSFSFEMQASPHSNKNITVILGDKARTVLRKMQALSISFEDIADEFKQELIIGGHCLFLDNFKLKWAEMMIGSSFELPTLLIKVISTTKNTDIVLQQVRELITECHASLNYPAGSSHASLLDNASPLSAAVYQKRTAVVAYLLELGCDPLDELNGETILSYSKRRDDEKTSRDDFMGLVIDARRKSENDTTRISDVILKFLKSKASTSSSSTKISDSKDIFWSSSTAEVPAVAVTQQTVLSM